MSGLSDQEKAFFRKQQGYGNSKLKTIGFVLLVLLIGGVSLDALNGFSLIRAAKTPLLAFLGLIVLGIVSLLGEVVSERINAKDKKTNPLYLRTFHLVLLLGTMGLIVGAAWYLLGLLGWEM